MNFKAFKMDGLGNDFVIIDNRTDEIKLSSDQIIKICNRSFIGCDQLIIMIISWSQPINDRLQILIIWSLESLISSVLLSIITKSLPNPSILKALKFIYLYLTYLLTFWTSIILYRRFRKKQLFAVSLFTKRSTSVSDIRPLMR